ncbi:MAG: hypothetical protein HYY06_17790 [Deltaproteobacteria bacterium]|nr:hypothetical protein [Deltaproteobacteria bacterium]
MRKLTLIAVVSALFGCAGGAVTGSGTESLTQERIESTKWVYNPQLTDTPIAVDDLVGTQEGFFEVDLRRYGDEVVACECGRTGRAVGIWRDGDVQQSNGGDEVVVPGDGDDGNWDLDEDVNLARTNQGRNQFAPDGTRMDDGFGLDRFGDDVRRTMEQSDFYVFHPGCV